MGFGFSTPIPNTTTQLSCIGSNIDFDVVTFFRTHPYVGDTSDVFHVTTSNNSLVRSALCVWHTTNARARHKKQDCSSVVNVGRWCAWVTLWCCVSCKDSRAGMLERRNRSSRVSRISSCGRAGESMNSNNPIIVRTAFFKMSSARRSRAPLLCLSCLISSRFRNREREVIIATEVVWMLLLRFIHGGAFKWFQGKIKRLLRTFVRRYNCGYFPLYSFV